MTIINLDIEAIIQPKESADVTATKPYEALLAVIEPPFLAAILCQTSNNKFRAAKLAGLDRGTLDRKLEKYGMSITRSLKSSEVVK